MVGKKLLCIERTSSFTTREKRPRFFCTHHKINAASELSAPLRRTRIALAWSMERLLVRLLAEFLRLFRVARLQQDAPAPAPVSSIRVGLGEIIVLVTRRWLAEAPVHSDLSGPGL